MSEVCSESIQKLVKQRAAVNVDPWDPLDPVANAVLDLIKAQNAVLRTIKATGEARDDGTFATLDEVEAAFDARSEAIMELLAAHAAYWGRRRIWWRVAGKETGMR